MTRDLRKDEPYLAYADFDFKVCCATAGDCFARYLVRMAEMRESLKIVEQAIENLPAGPVNVGDRRADRAARPSSRSISTIEGTDLALRAGDDQPRLRGARRTKCYAAIEAPNGELGFYLVGDGSDVAYRARCRPPSFIHFALFPHLIRGHTCSATSWRCWAA